MKNRKKLLTLVCCLAIVAAVSLGATVAYLTAHGSVTNTFTLGKINPPDPDIDPELAGFLDEAKVDEYGVEDEEAEKRVLANEYKLIPGHTYTKDPTVHIGPDSEPCYVFVKIENGISDVTEIIAPVSGWTKFDSEDNVWYQTYTTNDDENVDFVVFQTFKVLGTATDTALEAVKDESIVVNAYIIQSDGFETVADAWAEVKPADESSKTE